MSFFYVRNLTEQTLLPEPAPWTFAPATPISEQVKHDKKARQDWYRTASTVHHFYTAVEPANPNQRVGKSNPPLRIHAIVADYDLPLDAERIGAAIMKMKLRPSWVERSLGGNCRLVWLLDRPFLVGSYDFAVFILQQAKEWLQLELLPGLDAPALEDPSRLYCNGGEWAGTDAPAVNENLCQGFFVECGSKYVFKDVGTGVEIPLDIVEKKLIEKFPGFSWPGPFELNSQGPSFWVAGTTSAMSAILKKDGIFTFAAHADKPFYSWADLLGADFAKEFQTNAVALATKDVFWDGRLYWVMSETDERFVSLPKEALITRLRVRARVSPKPGKDGVSMLDKCLDFIHEFSRVEGGAPVLFKPPGRIDYNGTRLVNTAPKSKLVRPSGVSAAWGIHFPFVSRVLENLFEPASQLEPFRCWAAYFYKHAYAGTPSPGQNVFILGGAGCGKTLTTRYIIGGLMGGFCDASKYLLGSCAFNSSLFSAALWACDDENSFGNDATHKVFQSYIKSCAANQDFRYSKKFESDLTLSWSGRICVTANADEASARCLPALDVSILDKVSFFRAVSEPNIKFPEREEIQKILLGELPHFAQWLLDYKIPSEWRGDSRFGVRPHHESTLLDRAHQSGKSAPFKEILVDFLTRYFDDNKSATEWRGSVTQLMRALHSDPLNFEVMRTMKLESISRHCESLAKEGVLACTSENGKRKTRIWRFPRFE